ncbi:amino acid adenylation domain-containing protein [Paraliomyxa miuraensis]|uniref:amino acid adenylation domain-containing protein n=1 Tax=Paraliomyxa miuraensis TaxID=376150 RepID=UPI002253ABD5|nr:amino acid adenylation domain-containing protein [Paraliomyxa miuraensis]MCX4241015.1 amino acid adenylation domain-containing protein [Paraliomyxa miuraensis]
MSHAPPATLAAALRRAAVAHGSRPAVHDLRRSVTYAQLHQRVLAAAACLSARGVARGDRVAVRMDKGLPAVVALHAIHAMGAVFVPLDVRAPPLRAARILADCGVRHVLADRAGLRQRGAIDEACPELEWVSELGELATTEAPPGAQPELEEPGPDELAYILYTSGTTGTPKGIVHTHRSALAFAGWAAEHYGLRPDDRVSSHAPFHFDLSTLDLYSTVLAGACVVLLPPSILSFPFELVRVAHEQALTVWYSVPLALTELLERGQLEQRPLPALRWVLFAGEPFPTAKLRRLARALPHARLSNLYGPTETNVCTFHDVVDIPDDDTPIPIGRPCPGARLRLRDADGRVLPLDALEPAAGELEGELLVHGPTLMRGYWGNPEADAAAFWVADDGTRYYRTGDRVRLGRDGALSFLGRRDRQIKLRGHRIELDEIEHALASHPAVEACAALVVRRSGSDVLHAAVVPTLERRSDPALDVELHAHMAARLPPYTMPSIEFHAALPRTSTGKIDRRALVAIVSARHRDPTPDPSQEPP